VLPIRFVGNFLNVVHPVNIASRADSSFVAAETWNLEFRNVEGTKDSM
jgi:hypothetical protein